MNRSKILEKHSLTFTFSEPPLSSPFGGHILIVTDRKYTHKLFLINADAPIVAVNTVRSAWSKASWLRTWMCSEYASRMRMIQSAHCDYHTNHSSRELTQQFICRFCDCTDEFLRTGGFHNYLFYLSRLVQVQKSGISLVCRVVFVLPPLDHLDRCKWCGTRKI